MFRRGVACHSHYLLCHLVHKYLEVWVGGGGGGWGGAGLTAMEKGGHTPFTSYLVEAVFCQFLVQCSEFCFGSDDPNPSAHRLLCPNICVTPRGIQASLMDYVDL